MTIPCTVLSSMLFVREWHGDHTVHSSMLFVREWHGHHTVHSSMLFVREWHGHHTVHSSMLFVRVWLLEPPRFSTFTSFLSFCLPQSQQKHFSVKGRGELYSVKGRGRAWLKASANSIVHAL